MTRPDELIHRFKYHPPSTPGVAVDHASVREAMAGAALRVLDLCPEGREQALAITKLEEAMFWANAAIARNQQDGAA